MSDNFSFDDEFQKLTAQLEDISEEVELPGLSMFDLAVTLQVVHEASTYLAEIMALALAVSDNPIVDLPDDLALVIPHFRRVAETIADSLHHVLCENCRDEHPCECDESDEENQ